MKVKAPENRRSFHHAWDEISYLHDQMLYWLFRRNNGRRANRFSSRLAILLGKHDPRCEAILGAACRALWAEAAGDYWMAIRARERELELIDTLSKTNAPPETKFAADEVSDRMDLLAGLYWKSGDLEKAEEVLRESRAFCAEHGIKFDGAGMLRELLQEKRAIGKRGAPPKRRAS